MIAVAPRSLLKVSNETFHHSKEALVLAVLRGSPSKDFVEILRIIQEDGVKHETLLVYIVEGRATFRRLLKVKASQQNPTVAALDQSICVIQSVPSCLTHAVMTATINNHGSFNNN